VGLACLQRIRFDWPKKTNLDSAKLNIQKKADAKKVANHKAINQKWKECKVWGDVGRRSPIGVMMVYRVLSSRKGQFNLHS
jgi:hypothetical protein